MNEKEIKKAKARKYYLENREYIIQRNTEYHHNNKIKKIEYMKEYNKKYYIKNKHNWNKRYNSKSEEEKQAIKNKYKDKKKKNIIKLKEEPYKPPNFLITFN